MSSQPRRVLHVLPWLSSGGVEKCRAVLAEGLDPNEFEVRMVCKEATGPVPEQIRAAGVQVDVVPGSWTLGDLRSMRRLRAIAREFRPEIIHGAVYEGIIMGAAASFLSGAEFVAEEIDYPITRSGRGHWLFRRLTAHAEAVVCVSPSVATFMRDVGGVSPAKLRVILNAVPDPDLPPIAERSSIRRELGIPEGATVIGSIGRMNDAHKRFSVLIEAFARLAETRPEAHLLLVGGGDDLEALRTLSDELGLTGRVHAPGFRADIDRMLLAMDIFALVSNRESFGLVIAEAMYAALPVVCTAKGGMRDVIAEGETALVCELDHPVSLAAQLERLLSDPSLRRRLGDAGRRRAEAEFSTDRYCAEMSALYRGLSPRRRNASR